MDTKQRLAEMKKVPLYKLNSLCMHYLRTQNPYEEEKWKNALSTKMQKAFLCIKFLHANVQCLPILYTKFYLTIGSLYRHMVWSVPVSCKANGDRNQSGAWLDSDLIVK